MKTFSKSLISTILLALLLASCQEESLDSLTGKYTPPEVFDFSVIDSQNREKVGSLFVFSINLKDESSNTLSLKLMAADYALPASDYTPGDTPANKTYLIGSDGSTCNGQQISKGTISVSLEGNTYSLEGILYLADETVVKMTASFSIIYEYIPIFTHSVDTQTPALDGNGNAIAGTTKHLVTVRGDGVTIAYFELIASETASSLSGTYTIIDGINAAGQINNGYYLDMAWYGFSGVQEGGSYYIKNGEKQYLRAEGGDITIVDDGETLTFTGDNLAVLDLETLISSNGSTWQNKSETVDLNIVKATRAVNLISASVNDLTAYEMGYTVTLKLATDGVTPTYNADTGSWSYAGNGNVLSLDFKRDGAALPAGVYNVVSNEAAKVGDCYAGYGLYGMTLGCSWGKVSDGVPASPAYITSGTVEVILEEEGYIIIVDVSTNDGAVKTTYSGPIAF